MSPYVHWRAERDGPAPGEPLRGPVPAPLADAVARDYDVPLALALPQRAINPGFARRADPWMPGPGAALPAPPEPGTTVLGVVDTGIPLSHRALRGAAGSRVLAAWQQGAPWAAPGGSGAGQDWLPFGHELWRPQLDALLATHALGRGRYDVDEQGFMTAARQIDMIRAAGERELMRARAHGAGVVDLAAWPVAEAGAEGPEEGPPLVLVNLPDREALGTAGGFLDLFALAAIHRIAAVADHLWDRLPEERRAAEEVQGYPLVVNFSFGLQAGGRSAGAGLARGMAELNEARRAAGRSKLHLVLPAGNDNLMSGHATLDLEPGAEDALGWTLPPCDETCNFLEIWSQPRPGAGTRGASGLSLRMRAPGAAAPGWTELSHGRHEEVAPGIRAYCEAVEAEPGADGGARHALRVVLCTEPTDPHAVGAPRVRSGRWTLGLRAGKEALRLGLAVQTDLPLRRGSATARRSYLEDAALRRHDEATGRRLSGHPYAERIGARTPPAPVASPDRGVMSRGTVNAYVGVPGAVVVAGHRASDGRPADYSGAGGPGPGDPMPTVSLPVDRAPGAPGLLVAGSADGPRHPRGGTSFASAMAARRAAALLRGRPGFGVDLAAELAARAAADEAAAPANYGPAHPEKVGAGRAREEDDRRPYGAAG